MGRPEVRAAVQAWFAPTHVAKLNRVDKAKPRNIDRKNIVAGTDTYGAIAYVFIEATRESRIAGPAGAGKKRLDYDIGLIYLFRSRSRSAIDAMDQLDTFIADVKTRLRADSTFGGTVWSAGQQLLEDLTDDTQYDATTQTVWGVVRFDVVEWVAA